MSRNRLHCGINNKKTIIVVMAIACQSIIVMAALSPCAHIQVAAQQQENSNNNNNNNTPKLFLPTISTAVQTGAAATGVIVTVTGFLRTRKQSKCLSTHLLLADSYIAIIAR